MPTTLTGFRDYAQERGYSALGYASDADANAALVRGRDYIQTEYVSAFPVEADVDIANVEQATYEAALAELDADGGLKQPSFWNSVYTPSDRKVLVGVEGIRWQVVGGDSRAYPVSSRIEALLRRYTMRYGAAVAVV